jgi:chemotaxis protein histidine kinase CheA
MVNEKYKKLFLTEADEKIIALNKALLGLEKKPGNLKLANDAMRAAHTLKSSAAAMDFMGIWRTQWKIYLRRYEKIRIS